MKESMRLLEAPLREAGVEGAYDASPRRRRNLGETKLAPTCPRRSNAGVGLVLARERRARARRYKTLKPGAFKADLWRYAGPEPKRLRAASSFRATWGGRGPKHPPNASLRARRGAGAVLNTLSRISATFRVGSHVGATRSSGSAAASTPTRRCAWRSTGTRSWARRRTRTASNSTAAGPPSSRAATERKSRPLVRSVLSSSKGRHPHFVAANTSRDGARRVRGTGSVTWIVRGRVAAPPRLGRG